MAQLFTKNIKHPIEFSKLSGETQVIDKLQAIDQSIGLILTTARGELFGDPDFGCNLYTYLYQYSGPALHSLIKKDIVDSLNKWDTRIYVSENDIECTDDLNEKTVNIKVKYHLRRTEYTSTYIFSLTKNNQGLI